MLDLYLSIVMNLLQDILSIAETKDEGLQIKRTIDCILLWTPIQKGT